MNTLSVFTPKSNVIFHDKCRTSIQKTLENIEEIIGRTMGPYGSNAILADKYLNHVITKDGYEILKRLTFVQRESTVILDIIKETSRRLVRKVGDGSSTAVVSSSRLYKELLLQSTGANIRPGALAIALKVVSKIIGEQILNNSRNIEDLSLEKNKKLLYNVATIAANNDKRAGKIISDIFINYGKDFNISVERSNTDQTNITLRDGYKFFRGAVDKSFLDDNSQERKLIGPKIILFKGVLTFELFSMYFTEIMNRCFALGKSFVIIAEDYEPELLSHIIRQRISNQLPILLIDHSLGSENSKESFEDISFVTGARVLTKDDILTFSEAENEFILLPDSILGSSMSVHSSLNETTIFHEEELKDEINSRINNLKVILEEKENLNTDNTQDIIISDLKSRIFSLSGKEIILTVGGATESEKVAALHLYDDAALACKAALETGISLGLGISILNLIESSFDFLSTLSLTQLKTELPISDNEITKIISIVLNSIKEAWVSVAVSVLDNGGHPSSKEEILERIAKNNGNISWRKENPNKDEEDEEIILPALTDKETLLAVASIVSLLISSDQIVLTSPLTEIENND